MTYENDPEGSGLIYHDFSDDWDEILSDLLEKGYKVKMKDPPEDNDYVEHTKYFTVTLDQRMVFDKNGALKILKGPIQTESSIINTRIGAYFPKELRRGALEIMLAIEPEIGFNTKKNLDDIKALFVELMENAKKGTISLYPV